MILRVEVILRHEEQDLRFSNESVLDSIDEAEETGRQFWLLAYAFGEGIDNARHQLSSEEDEDYEGDDDD